MIDLLREELQIIIKDWDALQLQPEKIKNLKNKFLHKIELVEEFFIDGLIRNYFNCYAFALKLHDDREIKEILKNNLSEQAIYNSQFIRLLIDKKVIIEKEEGDIIIYFENGNPSHAGIFIKEEEKVLSKWGVGHIWKHNILEVPASYGKKYNFFKCLDYKLLKEVALGFASNLDGFLR